MNNDTQLDPFESALLAELRREVSEHPAPETTAATSRRPRGRRLLAGAATVVAASVVAVFGLGAGGGSPAYAVDENSAGDIVVTIHRLADAGGLEQALADRGIDADVSYDPDGHAGEYAVNGDDNGAPPPAPGSAPQSGTQTSGEPGDDSGPTLSGPNGSLDQTCGPVGVAPATLQHAGSDWVLTVPQGSLLLDRHVQIGTDSSGALSVRYAGDQPGSYCAVTTSGTLPGANSGYSGSAPGRP